MTIESHMACSWRGFEYNLRLGEPAAAPGNRDQLARPTFAGAPVIPYIQQGAGEPVAGPRPGPQKKGPHSSPESGKFGEPTTPAQAPATASDDPLPPFPGQMTKPIPPRPRPELPVIPPFNPTLPPGDKFAPLPIPPNPDLLPVPNPPLPIPDSRIERPPVPEEPLPKVPPVLEPPPAAPLSLKGGAALPAVLEAIPVVPFQPGTPVVIPASGTSPRK
jgi:hypothetical protein